MIGREFVTLLLLATILGLTVILCNEDKVDQIYLEEFIRAEVSKQMNRWSPTVVYGKYVTVVDGAEVMVREVEPSPNNNQQ